MPKRSTKRAAHHQTFPPTRPVFGSWGGLSHRASRTRGHCSPPSSRRTRIRTSTNCQMSPAVREISSASARGSRPPSWSLSQGATIRAEDPHRDGCRRPPHPKDLRERVLPYKLMPINLVGPLFQRLFHGRSTTIIVAPKKSPHQWLPPIPAYGTQGVSQPDFDRRLSGQKAAPLLCMECHEGPAPPLN